MNLSIGKKVYQQGHFKILAFADICKFWSTWTSEKEGPCWYIKNK